MNRHFDDAGYDVHDDAGGRSSRKTVGIAVAAALVVAAGVLGVVAISRESQQQAEAEHVSAQFVASSGKSGEVSEDDIASLRPVAEQALAASLPDPAGITSQVAPEALIPARVLQAYRSSEEQLAAAEPGCHLPWWLLAGAGKVASDHAAGGQVDTAGATTVRILGPRLDGNLIGTSIVRDTDKGQLDGDLSFDRGVGPMLILPATWSSLGVDGNSDGVADVHNIDDAARTLGSVLCAAGGDLSKPKPLAKAVLTVKPQLRDASDVLAWGAYYQRVLGDGSPSAVASASPSAMPSAAAPGAPVPAPTTAPPTSDTPRYTTVPTNTQASTAPPAGVPAPPITARPSVAPRPTAAPARPTAAPGRPTAAPAQPVPPARPSQPAHPTPAPAPALPPAPAPSRPAVRPSDPPPQKVPDAPAPKPTEPAQPVEPAPPVQPVQPVEPAPVQPAPPRVPAPPAQEAPEVPPAPAIDQAPAARRVVPAPQAPVGERLPSAEAATPGADQS
ncbi:lysozyme family protein [Gephyromycinifex aptenodytis]|uniref:hypothetical protein n=1 Tax=Gephyromycinifex aptenodytis TaxID=2716227 RepID=UPI0014455387|nr:hypothetical protein [Gephyromycinifex aptenodytis]